MRLIYLQANQAWVFVFGSDIRTASLQDMGGFGTFFKTRQEAVEAARVCGITVNENGECK